MKVCTLFVTYCTEEFGSTTVYNLICDIFKGPQHLRGA